MSTPFFTVIIPTYNRAELLKEAIQSVLDQTYQNFELIIIDDHSTDNTKEVIGLFKDNRIKYVDNTRTKGAAGARNTGIFMANGEWITFLDSDDIWLPRKLEIQYNIIQEIDEAVRFIYGGYAIYDFESKNIVRSYLPEVEGWIQKKLLYNNYITAINSIAVRKDLLRQIGGFDENLTGKEDWELYIRITAFTKTVMIKEVFSYVRVSHSDHIGADTKSQLQSAILIREKHIKLIRKNPKLCYQRSSTILLYALELRDWRTVLKEVPCTCIGLFFDPCHFIKTIYMSFSKLV